MSGAGDWQRSAAIRRIQRDQLEMVPPPIRRSIEAAARYVGAEANVVEAWWRAR